MSTFVLLGNLGADPETRVTPNGQKMTILRLAQQIYQNGKDDVIWWRIIVWGDDHKGIIEWLKKGSAVQVTGEMRTKPEIYTDKSGQQQVSLTLTALAIRFASSSRGERAVQDPQKQGGMAAANPQRVGVSAKEPGFLPGGNPNNSASQYAYGTAGSNAAEEEDEEEIPF